MQKLYVESAFTHDPTTVWSVFEGDAFREALGAKTGLRAEVLDTTDDGNVQVRTLRYTSATELPTVVAKALGSKQLSYVQENRFDRAASALTWRVDLPSLGDRVSIHGVTTIRPDPAGSRRVVDGTIEVGVRFIGGQIEKVVASRFRDSMEEAVALARTLLP